MTQGSEGWTGKEAPSPAATVEKPSLLSRFSSANKKKADDPFRFQGAGVDYKGKLIGIQEVAEARGDKMCQEAMTIAKALVKASGQHKQRILLNISLDGIKLKDEKTGNELYTFPVSKISFIARDVSDARAFGFVYGTAESKHKFYAIKTAQTADHAVLAIRDMFHIVYEVKKKQLDEGKERAASVAAGDETAAAEATKAEANGGEGGGGGGIADLLCLEEEVAGLESGMGNQDWATFEASAAAPHPSGQAETGTAAFGGTDFFTSSTGSTAYPEDSFGGSFNTTISSSASGPLAASLGSAAPQQTAPPPAFAASQAPAGNDPFDTSHLNQMLSPPGGWMSGAEKTSTPKAGDESARLASANLSSIRGPPPSLYSNTLSAMSASVFESPPDTTADESSKGRWPTSFEDELSVFNRAGLSSLLDGPAPEGLESAAFGEEPKETAAVDENPLAGLSSPEGIDDALGKLTADLMGGAKKSPIPGVGTPQKEEDKLSPFDRLKKSEKKSMAELMGASGTTGNGAANGATPKAPLNISQLYAQAPPPPQQPMMGQMPPMGMMAQPPPATTNPFLAQQPPQQLPPNAYSAPNLQANPFASGGAMTGLGMGVGGGASNPGLLPPPPTAANGGAFPARPRPTPSAAAVPAAGNVAIGDPFADPFFK